MIRNFRDISNLLHPDETFDMQQAYQVVRKQVIDKLEK